MLVAPQARVAHRMVSEGVVEDSEEEGVVEDLEAEVVLVDQDLMVAQCVVAFVAEEISVVDVVLLMDTEVVSEEI